MTYLILHSGRRVGLAGDFMIALARMREAGNGASVVRVSDGVIMALRMNAEHGIRGAIAELREASRLRKASAAGGYGRPCASSVAPPLADQRGTIPTADESGVRLVVEREEVA